MLDEINFGGPETNIYAFYIFKEQIMAILKFIYKTLRKFAGFAGFNLIVQKRNKKDRLFIHNLNGHAILVKISNQQ